MNFRINEVFQEYDQMRQALADEGMCAPNDKILIAIEDVMVETKLDYLMKRLESMDYALMNMI